MNEDSLDNMMFNYKPDVTDELVELSKSVDGVDPEYVMKVLDYYFWANDVLTGEILLNIVDNNNIQFCELLAEYENNYISDPRVFRMVWTQIFKASIIGDSVNNEIIAWLINNGKIDSVDLLDAVVANPENINKIADLFIRLNIYVDCPNFYNERNYVKFLTDITRFVDSGDKLVEFFKHIKGIYFPPEYFVSLAKWLDNPSFLPEDYANVLSLDTSVVNENAGRIFYEYVFNDRNDLLIALLAQYNPKYSGMIDIDLSYEGILEAFIEEHVPLCAYGSKFDNAKLVGVVFNDLTDWGGDLDTGLDLFDYIENFDLPSVFFTDPYDFYVKGFFNFDLTTDQYARLFKHYKDLKSEAIRFLSIYCGYPISNKARIITALLRVVTRNGNIPVKVGKYYTELYNLLKNANSKYIFDPDFSASDRKTLESMKELIGKIYQLEPSGFLKKVLETSWLNRSEEVLSERLLEYINSL